VILIVVIGGRITPAFTANALRLRGVQAAVHSRPWLNRLAITSVVAVAAADLLAPGSRAGAALACTAGLLVAARMAGWQTARVARDPLLVSLHAGLAWVAVGLVSSARAGCSPLAWTAGLHALTAGAMGSMILAVMTRVSLGHTGRPLVLPAGAAGCYLLVHAGAAARVGSGLAPATLQPAVLVAAGLLWAAAFWLFTLLYWRILTTPRVDGKEG
jgi:uncharacterized protein involved in response to NO